MQLANSPTRYGTVAKVLHWATVLLIFTLVPTGIIANDLADGPDPLSAARLFSIHKTLGVTLFALALVRIAWALTQPKPAPLHPDRRGETFLADLVHWLLYASLVLVPITGWVSHAASEGFAPIWWPFGQNLPFVPESLVVKEIAADLHIIFERVLVISILLHVAGALKHALVDRDGTLARMWFGNRDLPAPPPAPRGSRLLPVVAALGVYGVALGIGVSLGLLTAPEAEAEAGAEVALEEVSSDWQVTEGRLSIEVTQFGQPLTGSFADWTAEIAYDPETRSGETTVTVAIPSLTLGSVTKEAMGADWFDAATYPTAVFAATIRATDDAGGHVAEGTLTLKGRTVPVTLPFTLQIDGDTATARGETVVTRTDFGIGGASETNVALPVRIVVDLTAVRQKD